MNKYTQYESIEEQNKIHLQYKDNKSIKNTLPDYRIIVKLSILTFSSPLQEYPILYIYIPPFRG